MGISLRRIEDPAVNLTIVSGAPSRDEFLAFYRDLEDDDPANQAPWITFVDPRADLSALDLMVFVEMKKILTPKVRAFADGRRMPTAMVSESPVNATILGLWRGYAGNDPAYATRPAVFANIQGACDWLGLPQEAVGRVTEAVSEPEEAPAKAR